MKKFYFLLVAMLCSVAAQAWTVYFTNPQGWTGVYAYTYVKGQSIETLGGWPGTFMTKNGDVWEVSGDGEATHILFSNKGPLAGNGSAQTGDLTFEAGATYDMTGVVGAVAQDLSVYFDNTANWDEVYVYSWNPEVFGGYPGKKLTEKNADGLYVVTVSSTSDTPFAGFQFNNGKSGDEELKTTDQTWETGATYNAAGKVGDDPTPVEPNPMDQWYANIGGTFVPGEAEWNKFGVQPGTDYICNIGSFKIGTNRFDISVWDGVKDTYYGSAEKIVAGADKWNQLTENGGEMYVEGATADSEYYVQFNVETNQLCLTPITAGIEGVAADAAQAPAAYYNLQGIRVANPEAGVFIMVQGGKAVKVIK